MITDTYKYFTSFNEQNKWENTSQKHREIREYKKKKVVILWALVLKFVTNHSSHNYTVCHKLVNMQNIYMLFSMAI